ncbi:thioredoxin family protein [Priestia endophytica]|uniref:thioredoxin family protein n=1 Tax=Priestia endophytica TaxID=135735 RepID=UPI0022813897|nr:thioredoxin family protein [Priestia endophytica]MCY8232174.1 thioredoxin family protein [Priestia endophytica]
MKKLTSKEEFQQAIAGDEISVGIFTTTWCPDCKRLDMFIDDIINKHDDKKWFTVDRDELEEVADENQVMGIPSLLVYRNGEKTAHLHSANAKTPESVEEFLESVK